VRQNFLAQIYTNICFCGGKYFFALASHALHMQLRNLAWRSQCPPRCLLSVVLLRRNIPAETRKKLLFCCL